MVRAFLLLPALVSFTIGSSSPDEGCELTEAGKFLKHKLPELQGMTASARARGLANDATCPAACGWCNMIAANDSVKVRENISYGQAYNIETGRNEVLYMDEYTVPETQPGVDRKPVMVVIHGGGYMKSSNKNSLWAPIVSRFFAMYGFHTVSIEYRRLGDYCAESLTNPKPGCPEVMFGNPVEDARAAIRFLQENQETLSIDTSTIGAFGCSAGGWTVTHLLMTNYGEGKSGNLENPPAVHAGVSLSGGFVEVMNPWRKTRYGSIAPYMAIYGTSDALCPSFMSTDAITLAESLGAETRLLAVPDGKHCPNVITPPSPDYAFDQVMGFLAKSLELCGERTLLP
ncbi:unnamed protein product [Symbiodinium natans]|uniref:BD-FAE-like domain-containing protein n=1 Tax=Symbiodinium natans TaxID=878477 RepID=A0A812S6Z4_9DINO|nr:unnamed protein product [Symbiodinium natans]